MIVIVPNSDSHFNFFEVKETAANIITAITTIAKKYHLKPLKIFSLFNFLQNNYISGRGYIQYIITIYVIINVNYLNKFQLFKILYVLLNSFLNFLRYSFKVFISVTYPNKLLQFLENLYFSILFSCLIVVNKIRFYHK